MTLAHRDDWLEVHAGDCRAVLAELPADSVHCVVTSPPYFGLRDYGSGVWSGGDPDCQHSARRPAGDSDKSATSVGSSRDPIGATCRKCGAVRIEPTVWDAHGSGRLGVETFAGEPTGHVHSFEDLEPIARTAPPGSAKQASNRGANAVTARSSLCACGAWRGALGLEPTVEAYVDHVVEVMRAIRRVLRPDGTLWLNLGDSYVSNPGDRSKVGGFQADPSAARLEAEATMSTHHKRHAGAELKPKDLIGVPWRVALALQADGWWLRRDVIWDKPNPMPESVRDRPTSAHEYVFLFAKSPRYFFDGEAVREPSTERPSGNSERRVAVEGEGDRLNTHLGYGVPYQPDGTGRNIRSVWRIATAPYPDAHFATFPPELPRRCILAGTSERGACPECGAPWRRTVERTTHRAGHAAVAGRSAEDLNASGKWAEATRRGEGLSSGPVVEVRTLGWRPGCAHGRHVDAAVELEPDDLEVIATPANGRSDTPRPGGKLDTGRRGLDRQRAEGEGVRPITRFEQRRYADQLRELGEDQRASLRDQLGSEAWEHYTRKDRAGARPLPAEVLEELLDRGVLAYVEPPEWEALEPVPCVVLDPFAGSGTVGLVAQQHSRRAVLIDISTDYVQQQLKRTRQAPLGLVTA